ncbi:MAG: signal peptidase II [Gemmatimonadetes bacterium]|nr:signal peptidase II [Gemmatimonadota bacterium]
MTPEAPAASRPPLTAATRPFWMVVAAIVAADLATKLWAVEALAPRHVPHPVIGDVFRFTLTYNPGAAFGMHLGAFSRWIFAGLSVVIVTMLLRVTRDVVRQSRLAAVGVPIVVGGALGNLLDRIRVRDGVVDFIDIGVGSVRFWTFNLADTAVTIGAVCLVIALWRMDEASGAAAGEPGAAAP